MPGDDGKRADAVWLARASLVALCALFMLPILGALVLNIVAPHWLPFGQVNRGLLVEPAVMAELGKVKPKDGGPAGPLDKEAVWTLVHVGPAPCDAICQQALLSIRQARLALGKDAKRVDRWWLVTGPLGPDTVVRARELDPGVRVGSFDIHSPLRREFPIQLVDPAGYLILRYEDAGAATDVLKDMKRLLKISTQG